MSVAFTAQQQQACSCRNSSLIVSAAAGSGKTAVLVERVIGLLTDEKAPCGMDELLVVTFTNAAATEMRERVGQALQMRLSEEPNNTALRRQLALLGSSHIQTVHSFCQSLIRENFSLLGVEPDARLADDTQCRILKQKALEEILEQAYADPNRSFSLLCENLTDGRSDRALETAILDLYHRLCSHPAPQTMLKVLPGLSRLLPEESGWGRWQLSFAQKQAAFACKALERVRRSFADVPEVDQKYGALFDRYLLFGEALLDAMRQGWRQAQAQITSFEKGRLPACRYDDKAFLEQIQSGRDLFCKRIEALKNECFSQPVEQLEREGEQVFPLTEALCALTARFSEAYTRMKRQKGLLDFNDLEHLTLTLLQTERGEPSPLARSLRRRFREILVDEYQDTNEIQETIFRMLRGEQDSAFFVGDVKQSIYGFRLADPAIFSDRYESSSPYTGAEGGRLRISLNRNFRSRPEVLGFCNAVFSQAMTRDFGGVDYDEAQRLYPAREKANRPSELLLLDLPPRASVEQEEEEEQRAVLEARLVARRVERLLAEETVPEGEGVRRARPEDIAILLSSFSNKAPVYRQELQKIGIPCAAEDGLFFGTMEISILLSLLRLICNRRQDIPLVSLLRSPFYFFSAEKLAEIRLADREGDLIDGLSAMADADPSCRRVLEDLEHYAFEAEELPPSQLIRLIYDEKGAEGVFAAMDQGEARCRNLHRLEVLARPFDGQNGGLRAFLRWIDQKLADGEQPETPEEQGGGVTLMSIHHSKGLEYPFVIVPDLAKRFNSDDLRKPVMFHPDLGIGLRLRDERTRSERKTLLQQAIITRTRWDLRSEELRKLYVAMTRAREKLILVASDREMAKRIRTVWQETEGEPDPIWLSQQDNSLNWVIAALLRHPDAKALRSVLTQSPVPDPNAEQGILKVEIADVNALNVPGQKPLLPLEQASENWQHTVSAEEKAEYQPLLERASRQYPFLDATGLPSKLTPTGLKKLIPETGEIFGSPERANARDHHPLPLKKPDDLAAKRGIVMHTVLQGADLCLCRTEAGVRQQAARLRDQGLLTEEQLALLEAEPIMRFAASALARRCESAQRVLKEYQFSVLLPAKELLEKGPEGETILLNGAMDLLLFEQDGLTLVDFKSDRIFQGQQEEKAKEHALQLSLYRKAAEAIFGRPVKETWVWFLRAGCGVRLE